MPFSTPTLTLALLCALAVRLGAQVVLTDFPQDERLVARASASAQRAPLTIAGTVESAADLSARVVDGGGSVVSEASAALSAGTAFSLTVEVPVARRNYRVELLDAGEVVADAERVVAGDVYIVVGQSNAIAGYAMSAPDRDSFLRGFSVQTAEAYDWSLLGLAAPGEFAGRAASLLTERFQVPIAVFNFGVGAKGISFFGREATEPHPFNDTSVRLGDSSLTNFETIRDQLTRAGAIGKVRGVLWAQGEGDSFETPPGLYGEALSDLLDDYQREFGVERMYGIQTRFGACAGTQPFVMEDQRELHNRREDVHFTASTNVAQDADNCHFAFSRENPTSLFGLRLIGDWLADLITLHTYGQVPELGAAAFSPDIDSARVTGAREITLYFDDSGEEMDVTGAPWDEFVAEGVGALATSGTAVGDRVVLGFDDDVSLATGLTYLSHTGPSDAFIHNAAGVGAFTFWNVPTIAGDGEPGNLPDLDLTLESEAETVVPGENIVVEVVLRNTGPTTATEIELILPIPDGSNVGYVGSATPTPARGEFNPLVDTWTLPSLGPGMEASMTVTYFTQATTPATVTLWAEVSAQSGGDEDSTPGNAIGAGLPAGTVLEDDEARLVIGDRAADCVLSVEPTTSSCDGVGGTWTVGLTAVAGTVGDLEVSGLPGYAAASVALAEERLYTFEYGALRASGDTLLSIAAVRDGSCSNRFTLSPPSSCTGGSSGLFNRPTPLPLALSPNPVRAGRPLRVAYPRPAVPGAVRAELFDATGRRVWSGTVTGSFELPTDGLAGVYVLRAGRYVGRVVVR